MGQVDNPKFESTLLVPNASDSAQPVDESATIYIYPGASNNRDVLQNMLGTNPSWQDWRFFPANFGP